jgi:hypothetical protein
MSGGISKKTAIENFMIDAQPYQYCELVVHLYRKSTFDCQIDLALVTLDMPNIWKVMHIFRI